MIGCAITTLFWQIANAHISVNFQDEIAKPNFPESCKHALNDVTIPYVTRAIGANSIFVGGDVVDVDFYLLLSTRALPNHDAHISVNIQDEVVILYFSESCDHALNDGIII